MIQRSSHRKSIKRNYDTTIAFAVTQKGYNKVNVSVRGPLGYSGGRLLANCAIVLFNTWPTFSRCPYEHRISFEILGFRLCVEVKS